MDLIALIVGWGVPAKLAKQLLYGLLIVAIVVALGVAKCSYDKRVVAKHEQQVQQRAAPATDKAATERANDAVANNQTEQEMHNAIAAQPDQPIAPTSRALACQRLHNAGRHPAACS